MLQVFELKFGLLSIFQNSCEKPFDWRPLEDELSQWHVANAHMGLEPTITARPWVQSKKCVDQCGINPARLFLDDPWVCQHVEHCDCPCKVQIDADGYGLCHPGACECTQEARCTHTEKSLHSHLAGVLFGDTTEGGTEVLFRIIYGLARKEAPFAWKEVSALIEKNDANVISMDLIIKLLAIIFKEHFGITLSVSIHRRARPLTVLTTGYTRDHGKRAVAVENNIRRMSIYRWALLNLGTKYRLFEFMLGRTATCCGMTNVQCCLESFYHSRKLDDSHNIFEAFCDHARVLGDFDDGANVVNPVTCAAIIEGALRTPYNRDPSSHAGVVTGDDNTASVGYVICMPL